MTTPATVVVAHDGLLFDVRVGDAGAGTRAGAALLLHGFPGGPDTWDRWHERLHAIGLRTIVPAQRGYTAGARPRPVSAYRIDHLVDDAAGIVEQLHDGPVHVIGHDWGGVVAWHLAALRPDLVAGAVVLSTPHPRAFAASLARSTQALRSIYGVWFQLPAVPEATLAAKDAALLRSALRRSGLDPAFTDRYATAMQEPGRLRAALHWYRAAVRSPRLAALAGSVTVPTTYVWGARDPALGRRAAEHSADWVTGSYRFVELSGANHWLPEQHIDEVWPHVVERLHG